MAHTAYTWADLKRFGKEDRGGRWYPNDPFFVEYCRSYRPPSRSWPNSYAKACLTQKAYKAHQEFLQKTGGSFPIA